jgi:hypothetical protein
LWEASSPRAVSLYARAPGARPSGMRKCARHETQWRSDCSAKRTRPVPANCKKTRHLDAVRRGATRRDWGIQRAGCGNVLHAVALSIGHWDNVGRQMGSRKAAGGQQRLREAKSPAPCGIARGRLARLGWQAQDKRACGSNWSKPPCSVAEPPARGQRARTGWGRKRARTLVWIAP